MLNSLNKLSQNASGRVMPLPPGSGRGFPVKPTPSVGSGRGPIKPLPPGSGRGFPVKPTPVIGKPTSSGVRTNVGAGQGAPKYTGVRPINIVKPSPVPPRMKSGGLAGGHKAADGVAKKGRTQTKMVKMSSGKKMMGGGKC